MIKDEISNCDFCGEETGFSTPIGNHEWCKTIDLAKRTRLAQREFYARRRLVNKSEHDRLLHDALTLERELDIRLGIISALKPKESQATQESMLW